ncbi:MAG TPA: DUF4350 domain-containing protein [Verrucomicrobiae bacterium]|nr:DUF4350 domain-containing protein [Verrucomicrobiae bacterium]
MANDPSQPSFTPRQRFSIGFRVAILVTLCLGVAVMFNYLSGRHFKRFVLSTQNRVELSPRTESLLRLITNTVNVTVYFDRDEPDFRDVTALLKEYRAVNKQIQVHTIDYLREPGTALQVKEKFNLGGSTNNNFVIFEYEGRSKIVDAKTLTQVTIEQTTNPEAPFRRKPVSFSGEMMFTGALLSVLNPKPMQACYLQGHGEPALTDAGEMGYQTFASVLRQNYIDVRPLSLLGTNEVPDDCNLLIIAGPVNELPQVELTRVDKYLSDGGRLLALFDARSAAKATGVESILSRWGVFVGQDLVVDPNALVTGKDLVINTFTLHPAVNGAIGTGLYMVVPRPVSDGESDLPARGIAYTTDAAYLYSDKSKAPARRSVAVAVDDIGQGIVKARGVTRMVVIGDSFLWSNGHIEKAGNRDFLNSAVSWLADRTYVLEGTGPKPVSEFRLVITESRMQTLQWILLAGVPGGILLFGCFIWLARRK